MEFNEGKFNKIKEKAGRIYSEKKKIFCPYFGFVVVLNSDGFHHLQFSDRRERSKSEQFLKFSLLPLALKVINKSGTVQEVRKTMQPVGKKGRDGFRIVKDVHYWAFIAIVGDDKKIKIKTILKKIGEGNVIFWSVMPCSSLKNGQKLYSVNIEDE